MSVAEMKPRRGPGRLQVWHKISLVCLLFAVPISVVLLPLWQRLSADASTANRGLTGLQSLRPLRSVQEHLALHRLLAHRSLAGEPIAVEELAQHAAAIEAGLKELAASESRQGAGSSTAASIAEVQQDWHEVVRQLSSAKPAESDARHAALAGKLHALAAAIRADAGLTDSGLGHLDEIEERLDHLLTTAQVVAAREETTEAARFELALRAGQVQASLASWDRKQGSPAVRDSGALQTATRTLLDTVSLKLLTPQPSVRPDVLHLEGMRAMQAGWTQWDEEAAALESLSKERAAAARSSQALAVIGVCGSGLVVFILLVLVLHGPFRQVQSITAALEQIQQGNYQARAKVTSRDELGALAERINATLDETLALVQSREERDRIQEAIAKLLDDVSGVAEGDLSREAEVTADLTGAIADSFNYTIDQLRKIIGRVQDTTLQVSTSATQIHTSAEALVQGAQTQAEQIGATSAAIEDMAQSIQEVSANATVSSEVAQTALVRARNGNAAVQDTVAGMTRIRDQVQETAKRIKRLGESSQEIGQIVQLIDDIADRTSILALNASIQAAAAGDAGRGFAVVAEEIERLAVRSTEATRKIAGLVKTIQGETHEAVAAMEKGIQEVVEGSRLANQAGQALAEIEAVSRRLAELIQTITEAAEQQARGSEAVARSMSQISAITQQTTDGTRRTVASVTALAGLADDLRDSVSTFRLPGRQSIGGEGMLVIPSRPVNGTPVARKKSPRSREAIQIT